MASKMQRVNHIVSHLPGVKREVHGLGRSFEREADRLFAAHDRPGGHEIKGEKQDTDYLIHLEGRAPLSVEYGREAYTRKDGAQIGPMEGLHILGRAVDR